MANDLEALFAKHPPYSEEDLKKVIAYFRDERARFASGAKPTKSGAPKIEDAASAMEALGLAAPKAPPNPGFLKL